MINLEELQRKVPVVGDKVLLDLVNGVQVNRDIIRYRKNRGFFGRLLDELGGSDRQRQILLDGNLIAGQKALCDWILELTDSLRISQVALEFTQQSLLEVRSAMRRKKSDVQTLGQTFDYLTKQVDSKLNILEARIYNLEIENSARRDFEQIITAWLARQTYTGLPWLIQIILLIREVFSSSVALYELTVGDNREFRQLLANKIIAESKQMPANFFALYELLDKTYELMVDKEKELELATGLLEVRSIPQQRLLSTPYLFTIGTTLELASLPERIRPTKPAECAIELCRDQIEVISYTTDINELVPNLIEETANDCLSILSRRTNL
ncbi:YjcZ-like family protein [Aetokthonos hydrillicola Thurmond2011]|jgi:hypothetical protein|uniref:YjcZ-like family protein n=1 Tax=Aetokthonos hydrillicola Thurmond2011 TaxID=2712845 RepID=A0AAP5I633_9CYAN|nr:diguanylate cyclase regulator RdcB family protein [Aetokthonos hydrillicola]MBO3461502.1 hypothetical protein [Aetokthonos hydrillicola CCALA 1050]MBW4584860.1 YjcZ-like family protein [Aetokthonos hydrillicola CCALA 1050]MDR9895409.1 YjcZ-like family protein [Aetokthonos hydrillicola Thurmond2011]